MININSFKDINGEKWFSNTSYSKSITKISTGSIGKWKKILNEELYLLEMVLKRMDVYLNSKKFSRKI